MTFDQPGAKIVFLQLKQGSIRLLFQLLGQGIYLEVQIGCSLKDLLCTQLEISPDYLKNRIQTIFLNSNPVDAPESAMVASGSVIALSAAMPGLVGAVMRKGGHYATFRQSISAGASAECPEAARGIVTLKLFNLVASELGPSFLSRGVGLRGEDWQDFLRRHFDELAAGCAAAQVDGETVGLRDMLTMDWRGRSILLRAVL